MNSRSDLDALRAALQQKLAEDHAKRLRWGEQGPILNLDMDSWGQRIVAVYDRIHALPRDATYHDFLGYYLKLALGEDWWVEESAKCDETAHQVILWQRKLVQFYRRHASGGKMSAPITGVVGHYFRLAFDLHTIEHQGILQRSLVKRLKNSDQFQGARYEVAVSAAFVRAGFKVRLEDEGKGPDKLCEFVARHSRSDAAYSVEAKSRHLPGVLGRQQEPGRDETVEPNVSRIIRKALKKRADHPRVICVDVNVPPVDGPRIPPWAAVVRDQIHALKAVGLGPAVVFFTNSPSHYLGDEELVRPDAAMIMGLNEPRFDPQQPTKVEQQLPGLIRVGQAFATPVPTAWEDT